MLIGTKFDKWIRSILYENSFTSTYSGLSMRLYSARIHLIYLIYFVVVVAVVYLFCFRTLSRLVNNNAVFICTVSKKYVIHFLKKEKSCVFVWIFNAIVIYNVFRFLKNDCCLESLPSSQWMSDLVKIGSRKRDNIQQ